MSSYLVTCTTTDDWHDDVSSVDVLKTFDFLDDANEYAHYGYIVEEFGSDRRFENISRSSCEKQRARTFCIDAFGGTLYIRVIPKYHFHCAELH